ASPLSNVVEATTLGPPSLSVSPASLSAELFTGGSAERTLTLRNDGAGELTYELTAHRLVAGAYQTRAVRRTRTPGGIHRPDPGEPPAVAPPRTDLWNGSQSPLRARLLPGAIRLPPQLSAGGMRVAILRSGGDVSEMQSLLASFPDFARVDVIDGTSTT